MSSIIRCRARKGTRTREKKNKRHTMCRNSGKYSPQTPRLSRGAVADGRERVDKRDPTIVAAILFAWVSIALTFVIIVSPHARWNRNVPRNFRRSYYAFESTTEINVTTIK